MLDKKGRLPLRQALRITEEVLQGLQAIAEHGAVHGNVTPDGILLGYDGAARLDRLGAAAEGKPRFETTCYSLGCTLYEMLAGRPPDAAAPDLRTERPDLPEEVCRFVARLTAADPDARPAGPAEALEEMRVLAEDLARAGAIAPSRAAMGGGKRRLFGVTWTSAWTIVACLLVVATVAPFVIMAQMRRARIQAEQAAAAGKPGAVAVLILPEGRAARRPALRRGRPGRPRHAPLPPLLLPEARAR